MLFRASILLLLAVAVVLAPGCKKKNFADLEIPDSGIVRGDIEEGGGDFEFVSDSGGDPSQPVAGPFLIRGRNLHYDVGLNALVVDLTLVNDGGFVLPEPIGLTFVSLSPDGVTILNSDNDENGEGAMFDFQFADDDGQWSPGEESLRREVQFGVDRGIAISFLARVDVGGGIGEDDGSIGGMVWNDKNEDGKMDPDEGGLPGVTILLAADADGSDPAIDLSAVTAADGSYRFDDLRKDVYTVQKMETADVRSTTSAILHVLLPKKDNGVASFLMANFGCVAIDDSQDIQEGDFVKIIGDYLADPDRVLARSVEVKICRDGIATGAESPTSNQCYYDSQLKGPVTDLNRNNGWLEIMGTRVLVETVWPASAGTAESNSSSNLDLDDIEKDDRIQLRVIPSQTSSDILFGYRLRVWSDDSDRVYGRVQHVERDESGDIVCLEVLNTKILVLPGSGIFFSQDD